MFKLTRPCATCPFRKGNGPAFQLAAAWLREIEKAPAFQCHKTVDYDHFGHSRLQQGEHPQQCAGLMSLLHRAGRPNQIMQVGQRLGAWDPTKMDHSQVYATFTTARKAHR